MEILATFILGFILGCLVSRYIIKTYFYYKYIAECRKMENELDEFFEEM